MSYVSRISAAGFYDFETITSAAGFYSFATGESYIIQLLNELLNKHHPRFIKNEITASQNSTLGILLTRADNVISLSVASVDIELVREMDGQTQKKRVYIPKSKTTGFFLLKLKQIFPELSPNFIYSYCISSGETEIDTIVGCVNVFDRMTMSNLSYKFTNMENELIKRAQFEKEQSKKGAINGESDNAPGS